MGTRRRFILGTLGAATALVVGWSVLPPRQRLTTAQPRPAGPGQAALNGWVKVGSDDTVTVMVPKSEMGQGVLTALAMIVAEELDADFSRMRWENAPIDKIYNNLPVGVDGLPLHPDNQGTVRRVASWMTAKAMREIGLMVTGGSSSVKDVWEPLRQAGASARAMLVAAAAQAWGVNAAEVQVADGVLSHASGKRARFGDLAQAAARQPLQPDAPLKSPAQFKLIGKPARRIEHPAKLDGSARFGIDALPPGLLYASVLMCPVPGGSVASLDAKPAQNLPGVKQVLAVAGHHGGTAGVAVVADNPWRAKQALAAVKVQWNEGPAAGLDSAQVWQRLTSTLDTDSGFAYHQAGDVQAALGSAARTLSAEYRAPYLAHTPMEPMNCTVLHQPDKAAATVWAPTQVPGLARNVAAQVLGLKPEQVDLQLTLLGGGFGRRLDVDFVAQAAEIARALPGQPVQTLWSREQDVQHDFYRPACVSRFKAGLDAQGRVTAWWNTSAGQAIVPKVMKRAFDLPAGGPDKTTSEGAFDQPYEWPNARIAHAAVDLPVPVGFWRSVGHSHQAFFKEGFLDEVAVAVGADPVVYRSELLRSHPRHRAVLQKAAALAGWGQPLAPAEDGARKGRGVALHHSFGSIVAQVVEASAAADKTIRVHRVVCVIDCGLAINPNLIRQQLESAIVYGLSAALYGEITLDKGRVQQSNFHDTPVLRLSECPEIVCHVMPSTEPPEGVGEPGLPPVAPALANALFAATGQRLRALPLKLA
jgi:isoquinoline 1-oxidoreductase beta subunit